MINSRIFGIVFVVVVAAVTSIMTVTTVSSQNAMASVLAGFDIDTGNVYTSDADIDVDEAAEAGNATTPVVTNQTATNGSTTAVEFLAIQTAQPGSISQINATAYTLELNNVTNETILFSDRPTRIVETVSTADFIGNWTTGTDSFAVDAPNDALIVEDTQTGKMDTAIIELFDPMYDNNTNTLTYTIRADNATSIELPSEFGQSILMIDGAHPMHIHL